MTATDRWIQDSLAQIEALEEEHRELEAALEHTQDAGGLRVLNAEIERVEGELAELVAALEELADAKDATQTPAKMAPEDVPPPPLPGLQPAAGSTEQIVAATTDHGSDAQGQAAGETTADVQPEAQPAAQATSDVPEEQPAGVATQQAEQTPDVEEASPSAHAIAQAKERARRAQLEARRASMEAQIAAQRAAAQEAAAKEAQAAAQQAMAEARAAASPAAVEPAQHAQASQQVQAQPQHVQASQQAQAQPQHVQASQQAHGQPQHVQASPFAQTQPVHQASPFAQQSAFAPQHVQASPFVQPQASAFAQGQPVQTSPFAQQPSPFLKTVRQPISPAAQAWSSHSAPAHTDVRFSSTSMADYDYDEPRRGNGLMWGVLLVGLLIVGGGAGYLALSGNSQPKQAAAPVAPAGPVKVFAAKPVPPDTQGPGRIADANAEHTAGTEVKESGRRWSGARRSSGGSSPQPRRQRKRGTKVVHTDDPLDGFVE